MFGDPVCNSRSLPLLPLSEIGTITTGNTPSRAEPANYGGDLEWIKTDNIEADRYYITPAAETLSAIGASQARSVGAGAVLMACIAGSIASIGRVALADRRVAFNQQINAILPDARVAVSEFLYCLLRYGQGRVHAAVNGGMKGMVSKGSLSTIEFPVPPLDEQRAFVPVFHRCRSLMDKQRAASLDDEALFQVLAHRAFAGDL